MGDLNVNRFIKKITWADSTNELVQVDKDGFIWLDGVKAKRIGLCDSMIFASGNYWDTANLAIIHAELDDAQSKGFRVWACNLSHSGYNNNAAYTAVLDLLYQHKMLAVPLWCAKYEASLVDDYATADFSLGSETVTQGFTKWVNVVKSYQNVIAITLENELDVPQAGHTYVTSNLVAHMALMRNTAKALTNLQINTKFDGISVDLTGTVLDVHNEILKFSDQPCFDVYENTASAMANDCDVQLTYSSSRGRPFALWLTEFNYCTSGWVVQAANLTKAMMDAVLAKNVSVVFLWSVNCSTMAAGCFYDAVGAPIANLNTLAAYLPTWQVAI